MFRRGSNTEAGSGAKLHERGKIHVMVDRNLCFYCGACVAVCPPDSIFLENHHLKIDDQTCTLCERCTNMCPVHALTMQPIAQVAQPPA